MNEYGRLLQFINEFIPDFKMNSFNQRFLFQKLIYLADQLGFDFGARYSYRLYLRGPYSIDLSKSGFYTKNLLENYPDVDRSKYYGRYSSIDRQIIQQLKNVINKFGYSYDTIQEATLDDLELLTTLDFILRYRHSKLTEEKKLTKARQFLLKEKPQLENIIEDDDQFNKYVTILKTHFNLQDNFAYT